MSREVLVCSSEDIKDGAVRVVDIEGTEVGVIRHNGQCYAYQNLCPHQGGPVCEGLRMAKVEDVIDSSGLYVGQRFDDDDMHIVCPWHGYEYHLETGINVIDESLRLKKYSVTEREGNVYVAL